MRAPWKRAAAIALATCGFSALPLINGCKSDVEAADSKVAPDADKAVDALATSHPQAAREAVETAAGNKSTSPDVQIQNHLLAAQADLDAAAMLMSGPGPSDVSAAAFKAVVDGKAQSGTDVPSFTPQDRAALRGIEQRQNRVEQLLSQVAAVAGQMTLNNINVAGFKALEPAKAREALQQATNAAQKGENGAWVPGTAPIPSLEGLKAREQDLQKQITDLTGQRDDLNAKRGQALQQAAKFGQQADATTGSESVGFFTQSANQRKEAADDEVKIAQLEAQLAPLQQDLQLVQLQEKTIGDVLATYADQTQQVENGWKNVQQRIDQASALTKSLLEGSGEPAAAAAPSATAPAEGAGAAPAANVAATPRSLAGLAAELDNETKELQSLRAKTVALLNSAFKHYDDAGTLAATLTKNLNTLSNSPDSAKLPERRAWQERISLNSPALFKLGQAAVQNRFARLYTDEYAELARRNAVGKMVADALKGGGMAAPQPVAAALPPVGTVPVDVDTKLKEFQGDLKSEQPPFPKDATELNDLANGQTTPAGQQAIAATQADVAYHWAASLITDASSTAGSGDLGAMLANVCHAALMATNYGQAQFDLLQGKQQEGVALMKVATDERDKLADANAQGLLPAVLPADLAFQPKPAPGATTAPAPAAPPAAGPSPGTAATTPGAEAPALGKTAVFPTFGISFTPPQDVTAEPGAGSSPGYIATYHLVAPSPSAGAMVAVERLASEGANAQKLAEKIAEQTHGSVDSGAFNIGGDDAKKLTMAIQEGAYTSRVTYVAVHGSQGYLISAVSSPQASAAPVVDSLIKTVAFMRPDPPVKHLDEFFAEPFQVWGFSMNGPSCLRRVEASDSDVHLGIYDFSGSAMTNPFNLDLQHIVMNSAKSFADIRDTYSAALQKQLGLAQPLVWHEQPGVPGLNVTDPFKATTKLSNGEQGATTDRVCLLEAAPGDYTQMLFSISPDVADADAAAFAAAEDRMLASVKVAAAAAPGAATSPPTGTTPPTPGTTPPTPGTTPPAEGTTPTPGTTPPAPGTTAPAQ